MKACRSIDLPQYGLDALARERLTPALPGRSTAVNSSLPCPTGHSTNYSTDYNAHTPTLLGRNNDEVPGRVWRDERVLQSRCPPALPHQSQRGVSPSPLLFSDEVMMRSPTQQTALGPSRWGEHAAHDLYPAQHGRSLRLVPALASSRSDIYIPPSMGGRTGWSRRLHRLASRIYIPPSMGGRTGWSRRLHCLQKKNLYPAQHGRSHRAWLVPALAAARKTTKESQSSSA